MYKDKYIQDKYIKSHILYNLHTVQITAAKYKTNNIVKIDRYITR